MEQLQIETKKDLLNNALALFEWAAQESMRGQIIASLDESTGKYKEVVLPALQAVRSTKNDELSRLTQLLQTLHLQRKIATGKNDSGDIPPEYSELLEALGANHLLEDAEVQEESSV